MPAGVLVDKENLSFALGKSTMKFKLFIFIFLEILFHQTDCAIYSKLPQVACDIIAAQLEENAWTKTIAVMHFKNNFPRHVISSFYSCLPMEISVISIDSNDLKLNQPRIHNPTMVVVWLDDISTDTLIVSSGIYFLE